MNKKIRQNNNLVDLIKFLCAILVIFSHSFPIAQKQSDYIYLYTKSITFGGIAVSVFFTFSGYFITRSLLSKGNKNFIKKRFKRIFPQLFLVVLSSIFLLGPTFTNLKFSKYFLNYHTYLYLFNSVFIPIHNLPGVFEKNIYGTAVNGALWTLSVEFCCYIYIYIVSKLNLLNKKHFYKVTIFSVIMSLFAYYVLQKLNLTVLISFIRPFLIFLISSLIYIYCNKYNNNYFYVTIILTALVFLINNVIIYNLYFIFLFPSLLILLVNKYNVRNHIFSYLGVISYSIYLVGFPIQQSLTSIFGGMMNIYLNFFLSSIISIFIGIMINYKIIFKNRSNNEGSLSNSVGEQ